MTVSAAIVTTLRGAMPVLDYFISYHLALGFDHLFLFFDDPGDPAAGIARRYGQVTTVLHDAALREQWANTQTYRHGAAYRPYIDREVMARQLLNAEVAIGLARQKGITWLLHIDSDELFYPPATGVKRHFSALSAEGADTAVYYNHEAVPEAEEIEHFFGSVTLFKKNPVVLDLAQRAFISREPAFAGGHNYFRYYSNGKSAVRVREQALPTSVHSFAGQAPTTVIDAFILHYPVCGFGNFWDKYQQLGPFADCWFGELPIGEMVPFHLQARNAVQTHNRQQALDFYRQHVMLADQALIDRALRHGVFFRRTNP